MDNGQNETSNFSIPETQLTFDQKLEETEARLRIQAGILTDIEKEAAAGGDKNLELLGKMKLSSEKSSAAITDFDWATAMKIAGIPEEQILKIWELKEERTFKEKDLKNKVKNSKNEEAA